MIQGGTAAVQPVRGTVPLLGEAAGGDAGDDPDPAAPAVQAGAFDGARRGLLLHLIDPGFELLEQRLAAIQPGLRFAPVGGTEPIPLLHALEPVHDLLEFNADFFRFLVGEVLAVGFELDFLLEVDLAVLDDLLVMLGGLVEELLDQFLLLVVGGLAQGQEVVLAAGVADLSQDRADLAPNRRGVGKDADRLLEVDGSTFFSDRQTAMRPAVGLGVMRYTSTTKRVGLFRFAISSPEGRPLLYRSRLGSIYDSLGGCYATPGVCLGWISPEPIPTIPTSGSDSPR